MTMRSAGYILTPINWTDSAGQTRNGTRFCYFGSMDPKGRVPRKIGEMTMWEAGLNVVKMQQYVTLVSQGRAAEMQVNNYFIIIQRTNINNIYDTTFC